MRPDGAATGQQHLSHSCLTLRASAAAAVL